MIEYHFKQRSPEWHAWRATGVGASEAAAVEGDSPYMSEQELWEMKVGIRPPTVTNFVMQRGIDQEDEALSLYETLTGEIMAPLCASHDTYQYILASLDGINPRRTRAVEIKCPGVKSHELAMSGIIPLHYQWQMQQQMLVTGLDEMDYFSYIRNYPDKTKAGVLVPLMADKQMQERLIVDLKNFYDHVVNKVPMFSEGWDEAARAWLVASEELEWAKELLEIRREQLIQLAGGKSMKGAGVNLNFSSPKPKVDWDRFYQENSIKDESLKEFATTATVTTFDSKSFEKKVKPTEEMVAPYLLAAKEPTITIKKVDNVIDNEIQKVGAREVGAQRALDIKINVDLEAAYSF